MKLHKYEVVRFMHIFFCSALLILRAGLIFMAFSIRQNLYYFNNFIYEYVTVMTFYLFSSSAVFIVLSTIGIAAGVTSWRFLFKTYNINLAVLYMVEIVLYGVAFYMWMTLNSSVEEALNKQLLNYKSSPQDIDYLQKTLKCCGKYKEEEWFDIISYIPMSCCPSKPNDGEPYCVIPTDIMYIFLDTGCLKLLQELPHNGLTIITSIMVVLCIIEFFSLFVSCYAVRMISTQGSTKYTINVTENIPNKHKKRKSVEHYK